MSNDTLRMDVAGSLFTSMYRNVKIKGEEPAAMNLDGTGSVSASSRVPSMLLENLWCIGVLARELCASCIQE